MEDPQPLRNDDPSSQDDDALELQRRAEEAMERMLLEQEDEENLEAQEDGSGNQEDNFYGREPVEGEDPLVFAADDEDGNMHDDMAFLEEEELINNNNINNDFGEGTEKKNPFTYIRVSCWAAVFLIYYAFRSRQQWYLALVFLSSCKYAYVVLGNAYIAMLIWLFRVSTGFFLNGLRLNEAEGLGDYFRWHITETCLALTIFRSELNVKTFMLFIFLVFSKCLHHIVDAREAHLRMTEEIVVTDTSSGWPKLRYSHLKLFALISLLQVLDVISMVLCGQDIMNNGPSVVILFAFESAIMLTSVVSNSLLSYLHLIDGILHFLHETSDANSRMHRWIYPWKDHKATLMFAVELQAQAAKFIFYLTFFAIVFTYYGLPINLIREVYVSFLQLKSRVIAFNKYRQLMAAMNRFENPTEEELEKAGDICIICRETMTVETAKKLPGCGHIFRKSCLREWLVQQQTCPTCRGDISVMEARQKQQDRMARLLEEQQEQNQDDDQEEDSQEGEEEITNTANHEGIEGGTTEDDGSSGPVRACCKGLSLGMSKNETVKEKSPNTEIAKPTEPVIEKHTDRKPPPAPTVTDQRTITVKPNVIAAPSSNGLSGDTEYPAFPAFYRVVRDSGASVYREEKDDPNSCYVVTRVVPCGVVFVGTNIEYRKCVLTKQMMIQMPDGWVNEESVERIVALPINSSLAQQ